MKKQRVREVAVFTLGLVLLIVGIALWENKVGGVLLGVGAGLMGMSAARLYTGWVVAKDPKLARQVQIEEQDERLVHITARQGQGPRLSPCSSAALSLDSLPGPGAPVIVLLGVAIYVVDWVVYFFFYVKGPGNLVREMLRQILAPPR